MGCFSTDWAKPVKLELLCCFLISEILRLNRENMVVILDRILWSDLQPVLLSSAGSAVQLPHAKHCSSLLPRQRKPGFQVDLEIWKTTERLLEDIYRLKISFHFVFHFIWFAMMHLPCVSQAFHCLFSFNKVASECEAACSCFFFIVLWKYL